jgi:hypothetical protein
LIRDNVADGLADLCAALGLLENFRTDIGKPQIPRRPLEQPDAQLILELRHAPADGRDRHFEALCGFGEAPRLDELGKYRQRIEVNHRLFVYCCNRRLCRSSEILRPDLVWRVTGNELS